MLNSAPPLLGTAMSSPVRYIVLGLVADIETWRRERGVPRCEVIAVSTRNRHALRGLTHFAPGFEVVELPSWSAASPRVREEFKRNLRIVQQTVRARAWAQANPSLGHRVTEEAIASALNTDPAD